MERSSFIAQTSKGVLIETFERRDQALAWIEARGDLFPGWSIAVVTEVTITRTRVLRRDRSHLNAPTHQPQIGAVA